MLFVCSRRRRGLTRQFQTVFFFVFSFFLLVFILVPPSWDALVVLPLGAVFEKETATNPHTHIANSNVLFVAHLLNKKI